VEYFNYLGSVITNDERCKREFKCRIVDATATFDRKKFLFTSNLELILRKKLVRCYIWSRVLYDAQTRTLRTADQKQLERARNEEVDLRVACMYESRWGELSYIR
jgi:hypothetical protein